MGEKNLRSLAKERWRVRLPAIIKQAKVEALHNTGISNILCDAEDASEGMRYTFSHSLTHISRMELELMFP